MRDGMKAFLALSLFFLVPPHAFGQSGKPKEPASLATSLAEGWAALDDGDLATAARAAERAIRESPLSAAAVALAVDVEVARGGSLSGLDVYERWLGTRKVDDPYVLRRVALGHLRWSSQQQHVARMDAARALIADGDERAAAELMRAAAAGGHAEARVLASLGDPRGVEILIGQLRMPAGSKLGVIKALAESGSTLAVSPLLELLADRREDHRAAAADALGRLDASAAIPRIKPLLSDPVFPVRMAAAAALLRLGDHAGVNLLDELMTSEHPAVRLSAAEASAVQPTPSWLAVVRGLTSDPDSTIQLGAARLIAPFDQHLAAAVLERLATAQNPAIREEAGRAFVQHVAADFASLRRYLRSPHSLTAIRAASRILELTR